MFPPQSSTLLILLLSLATIFAASQTVSTSPVLINSNTGFKLTLRRIDSDGNFTTSQLLQRAMRRGRTRIQRLQAMTTTSQLAAAENNDTLIARVQIHSDFLIDLSVGTPPLPFSAALDTGINLIWTQCQPCKKCFNQSGPIFDPEGSSSFSNVPCINDICPANPDFSCSHDQMCMYFSQGLFDFSSTKGTVATETFTLDQVSIPNVTFGCGREQEGYFDGAGIVGLGRGDLSLVSQLGETVFSYCISSGGYDQSKSALFIGLPVNTSNIGESIFITTTPMIKNHNLPFYYISLVGISVGDTRQPIYKSDFEIKPDGSGGTIVDSGITFTYLKSNALNVVKEAFISQTTLPFIDSDYGLCFALPPKGEAYYLPTLTFHFEGGDVKVENYFITDEGENYDCLALLSSEDLSVLGSMMLENTLVEYDIGKERVSFVTSQVTSVCELT